MRTEDPKVLMKIIRTIKKDRKRILNDLNEARRKLKIYYNRCEDISFECSVALLPWVSAKKIRKIAIGEK